jgi:hypothetical protein
VEPAEADLRNELCSVDIDCDLGTTFRAAGEFSQTSPPCPEKLRTAPVEPVW